MKNPNLFLFWRKCRFLLIYAMFFSVATGFAQQPIAINIISDQEVACPRKGTNEFEVPECTRVCELSQGVTYSLTGDSSEWTTAVWEVAGGSIVSSNHTSCVVNWTAAGSGLVLVTITRLDGTQEVISICIEKIKNPGARFSVFPYPVGTPEIFVCEESVVYFTNLSSANGGSELETYYWEFGDGQISTEFSPSHQYVNSGNYTVNLTVTNACGCKSEFELKVIVGKGGFNIECGGVVCEGDRTSYHIPEDIFEQCMSNGSSFNWQVTNGTIVSPQPYGAQIQVDWNQPNGTGFGYVTFDASDCGLSCGAVSTLEIPIIEQNGQIIGQTQLCEEEQSIYSLPQWPSTQYNWTMTGPGNLVASQHANEIRFLASTAGIITLKCTYYNTLLSCGGTAEITITVKPNAQIDGTFFACVGETKNYTEISNGNGTWNLTGPIQTVNTNGTSFNHSFSVAGLYVLKFSSNNFCKPTERIIVVRDQEVTPTQIYGPLLACPGVPHTYSVNNNVPGTSIHWEVENGEVSGNGIGNAVSITFDTNPTGSYIVRAWRENNTDPNCPSDSIQITVTSPQVSLAFSGSTTICASSYANYEVDYLQGENYIWTIEPPEAGSVSQGNGTSGVEVLWNQDEYLNTKLKLSVIKCGVAYDFEYIVNVLLSPPIQLVNPPSDTCQGASTQFQLGAIPNLTNGQIIWDFGDGSSPRVFENPANGYNVSHTFNSNISEDTEYVVTVTAFGINGCIIPSVLQHTIIVKPAPSISITPNGTLYVCLEEESITDILVVSVSGDLSDYTFKWFKNNVLLVGQNSHTLNLADSNHQIGEYYATVTGPNDCSRNTSKVKLVNSCDCEDCGQSCTIDPNPTVTISGINDCGTVNLSGFASGSPLSTHWRAQNPDFVSSTVNNTTASYTYDLPGYYKFFYSAIYSTPEGNCGRSANTTVFIPYLPNISFSVGCEDGVGYIVTLQDNSLIHPDATITEYEFFVNNVSQGTITSSSQNVTLQPGTYEFKIRIKSANHPSCTSDIRTFELPAFPDATIVGTDAICVGLPATFVPANPQPGWSYYWELDQDVYNLQQDVYRVYDGSISPFEVKLTVTNQFGCSDTQSHFIDIEDNDLDGQISASGTSICTGGFIELFYDNGNPSNIPNLYNWKRNGSSIGSSTVPTFEVFQSGTYSVEVSNEFGCAREFGQVVLTFVYPNATISGALAKCAGQNFQLSIVGGQDANITWKRNNLVQTNLQNQASIVESLSEPGTYIYEVTLQLPDENGGFCEDTSTHTVVIHPNPATPTINISNHDCDLYLFELTADVGGVPGTFTWSNGGQGATTLVSQGGTYQVTFTNLSGCSKSATIFVPYDPSIHLWNVPVGCYDFCMEEVQLGNPYINGIDTVFRVWDWYYNQNNISNGNSSQIDPVFTQGYGPGSYHLTFGNNLCQITSGDVNINWIEDCRCELNVVLEDIRLTLDNMGNCFYEIQWQIDNPYGYDLSVSLSASPLEGFFILNTIQVPGSSSQLYQTLLIPLQNFGGPLNVFFETLLKDGTTCLVTVPIELPGCTNNARQIDDAIAPTMSWSVTPNPATTYVDCSYDLPSLQAETTVVTLTLYNVLGKAVATQTALGAQNTQQVDLKSLPSGVYVLILQTEDGQRLHQKIVKK